MRLEFDERGYVCCVLYGCSTGKCVEYSGTVPSAPEQYSDIDDWANRAQTQCYKLDEKGNLVYDSERAEFLPDENSIVPLGKEKIQALGIVDVIYPVGSLYMSLNDVNPEELFGGTWEAIEDKFILSSGAKVAGDEGGAESYDLSVSHSHVSPLGYNDNAFGAIAINGAVDAGNGKSFRTTDILYSGTLTTNVRSYKTGEAAVNATIPTMPPYLAVNVWKRTA